MYDYYEHGDEQHEQFGGMDDEKAAELRRFLEAADAALTREGLSRHPRPIFLDSLSKFLERYEARRILH